MCCLRTEKQRPARPLCLWLSVTLSCMPTASGQRRRVGSSWHRLADSCYRWRFHGGERSTESVSPVFGRWAYVSLVSSDEPDPFDCPRSVPQSCRPIFCLFSHATISAAFSVAISSLVRNKERSQRKYRIKLDVLRTVLRTLDVLVISVVWCFSFEEYEARTIVSVILKNWNCNLVYLFKSLAFSHVLKILQIPVI